jgi:hypothetical protein
MNILETYVYVEKGGNHYRRHDDGKKIVWCWWSEPDSQWRQVISAKY